jgi:hypothetical protein
MDQAVCWEISSQRCWEQVAYHGRSAEMDQAPEKLRALARQARALSAMAIDRHRSQALDTLARLYERQAKDLEALEPA